MQETAAFGTLSFIPAHELEQMGLFSRGSTGWQHRTVQLLDDLCSLLSLARSFKLSYKNIFLKFSKY
jgi:hypothetical protein